MSWKKWICVAGLSTGMMAGCGETDAPTPNDDVSTSNDELAGQLRGAKADGLDIRNLNDGRFVFYGDVARELLTLGNVSPRTQTQRGYDGLTYSQSPFAYCVSSDSDAACITFLPNATVENDTLTFGGSLSNPSVDARKANDIALTMYHGGYDSDAQGNMATFSKDGSPISCEYSRRNVECTIAPKGNDVTSRVTVEFDMLPELGADFVYEGWLIIDGAPVSAGRFDSADSFVFESSDDLSASTAYILTIEPRVGDDPAPSKTHLVGGAINGGTGDLTIDFAGALGTDFSTAAGTFILAAPTAGPEFANNGIWFLDPTGPAPSLELPTLPEGWVYEGWVATADGPISTGRFTDVAAADFDGAGATAGPNDAPPFPGQDFINPPVELPGNLAVISVEPQPDDSPAPFALKPLVGSITDAGMGVPQALELNGEAVVMGRVIIE